MDIDRTAAMRKGQALIEFAVSAFVFSLVLAALFSFARVILASLDIQRTVRMDAGRGALASSGMDGTYSSSKRGEEVEVEELSAKYLFGSPTVEMREEVYIPATREAL